MRLIDADTLINNLSEKEEEYSSAKAYETASIIHWIKTIYIDNLPTVDAEPIRHGHWFDDDTDEAGGIYTYTRCSVCGEYVVCDSVGQIIETPYCPWCGALMDEVKKDE